MRAGDVEEQQYGCRSDPGAVRTLNEDSYLADPEIGLWLVADGMGGHRSGDVASRIVRDTITEGVRNGAGLAEAIRSAHEQVLKEAGEREDAEGMGSTVVAVKVKDADYEVAWVGDSRAYLFDGELIQVTRDHSFVEDLVQKGSITAQEASSRPDRHLLTRCLGVTEADGLEVSVRHGRFTRGQEVLLCSDGLTDELTDHDIKSILLMDAPAQSRVDRLVDAAIENGGRDNVTAVLLSAPADAPGPGGWMRNVGMLAVGAGLAALILGLLFYFRAQGFI
jgi:PPM family protein phosphatase